MILFLQVGFRWLVVLGCLGFGFGLHGQIRNATPRDQLLLYTDSIGQPHPVESRRQWQKRREHILESMQEVMGPLPGKEKQVPLEPEVLRETIHDDYVLREVAYTTEPGSRLQAYLLIPLPALTSGKKYPAVLCLHQTHAAGSKVVVGLGNSPNDEYAVELVKRGYVCLAPPYPLLADYHPKLAELGYVSGTMKAIHDNRRSLDYLESLPFVRERFGAIGHSLGGHNGLYTAAFDDRLRVVVTSCGFDSYFDYMKGDIRGWTSERYMPRLKELFPDRLPFDFPEVLAAIAPRPVFVSAPMQDSNFQWKSVARVTQEARQVYRFLDAGDRLQVVHPASDHQFPKYVRHQAYEVIDAALK